MIHDRIHFQVIDDSGRDAPVTSDTRANHASLSDNESDTSDSDADGVNAFVDNSFDVVNEGVNTPPLPNVVSPLDCQQPIHVDVARLRVPSATEPQGNKRPRVTQTPLSEWQQSLENQRHDKSIQQFLSTRVSALQHEISR